MKINHISHPLGADRPARHGSKPNLARDSTRGKHVSGTAIHDGMTRRQMSMNAMGHAHANAPDANPASPFTAEPQGKRLTEVQPVPGQRRRVHDVAHAAPGVNHATNKPDVSALRALGARVLSEAAQRTRR